MTDDTPEVATTTRHAIAAEVRAELARQNKTQRDLAEILGLPQSSVNLRLKGERAFRAEEIVAMADGLHVPTERFLNIQIEPVAGVA
jgi:transcriptional regulator with XRE-family HTH domain